MVNQAKNSEENTSETNSVMLRDVLTEDVKVFFEHQLDPQANQMAAFTSKDPMDWNAFTRKWIKILTDDNNIKRTILFEGMVVGHVVKYDMFGQPEITYWIGKTYWGKGIATQALSLFLTELDLRPLHARAAKDNIASLRVLEKCGFQIVGEDKGFSNARDKEVEEYLLKLD